MHKLVFRFLLPVLLLGLMVPGWADLASPRGSTTLSPKPSQILVDQTVNGLLSRYHYGDKTLDDGLSDYIFKHYLKALDPAKFYFTQPDIDQFAAYRDQLGNDIRKGNLEPVFKIYNTYRKRVVAQVNYALEFLKSKPSLDTNESYTFDREKAPWAASESALDALWRKRVTNDLISLMLAGKSREEAADALRDRYKNYMSRAQRVDSADVFDTFMNTYAHAMDPHTAYFSPEQSEQFKIKMSLKLQGIGAALTVKNQYITVERVIPGGPAAKSDEVHAGDRIVGVAQGNKGKMTDVVGWRLSDVVNLIRGKKGTVVRLDILPRGATPGATRKGLRLVRNIIQLKAQQAKSEIIEISRHGKKQRIGVITVPSFYRDFHAEVEGKKDYRSTTRDVRKLIEKLKAKPVSALVIDLRNNPGGSLAEATEMTGLFINKGPVVQVRGSNGATKVRRNTKVDIAWRGPLVVLVNRFSASASEIFTAAIQDYHRGVIVGSTTYGKGTVQSLIDLSHFVSSDEAGQLKLTIAKFYRVTGSSTQDKGVAPDIVIPSAINTHEFGESTQDNAMPWDKIGAATFRPFADDFRTKLPILMKEHLHRTSDNPEYQLFLKGIRAQRERNDKTTVSLNLDARRELRNKHQAQNLAMINSWRKLDGKKSVKTLQELPEDADHPDVLLHEAAEIATDMSRLHLGIRSFESSGSKIAKKAVGGN